MSKMAFPLLRELHLNVVIDVELFHGLGLVMAMR
jgi:hypothetical protein